MLNALQINSYQLNRNNAVSQAVTGAKPDLVSNEQKSEQATLAKKPPASDHMTLSTGIANIAAYEKINKAIEEKITEFFSKYPNGGSDQEAAKFLENVELEGILAS